MKSSRSILLMLMFAPALGSFVACREDSGTSRSPGTPVSATASSVAFEIPDAGAQHPSTTSTAPGIGAFSALMQRLPASDQVRVREWYGQSGAPAMATASATQLEWMRQHGYPMPQDIARSASMSDAELKRGADAGNSVAAIIYAFRLLEKFKTLPEASRADARIALLGKIQHATLQALATGSPYAGYLYAARARMMYPNDFASNAAAQLAGSVWAAKFGDTRAATLMHDPAVQAVDATTAAAAMSAMLVMALNANPRLFATPAVPLPSS